MKGMRRAIGAAVVAMLLQRVQGRLLDRLRSAFRGDERSRFGQQAQAALSSIRAGDLADPLAALRTSTLAATLGVRPRRDRRDILVTALFAGTVAVAATAAAFAVATVLRSRRRATRTSADATAGRVAVPVVVPDDGQHDELRSIRGVGSISAERLRRIGITTVAQVAAWRPEDIQRIAEQIELSPERIEREDWVGQARAISGVETATDLA